MKTLFKIASVSFLGLASFCFAGSMGNGMMNDGVTMKDGQMMVMKGGESKPMTDSMKMTDGSTVMTSGRVLMPDGSKGMMKNGDMMGMDGKVTKATDGAPGAPAPAVITDGVIMKDGQTMVIKDGKASAMTEPMKMQDGTTVSVDGTVMKAKMPTMMMKNGDMISSDGKMFDGGNK